MNKKFVYQVGNNKKGGILIAKDPKENPRNVCTFELCPTYISYRSNLEENILRCGTVSKLSNL